MAILLNNNLHFLPRYQQILCILRISILMIVLLVLPVRDNYGNGYGNDRVDLFTPFLDTENAPGLGYDFANIANDDSILVSVRDTIQLYGGGKITTWKDLRIPASDLEIIKQKYDSVLIVENRIYVSPSELSLDFGRSIPELSWENILKAMRYEYKPFDDLVLNEELDFCRPYSISLHNSMQSTDKDFIVWIEHYFTSIDPVIKDTSIPLDSVIQAYNDDYKNVMKLLAGGINNYLTRMSFNVRNTHYISIIRDHLIDIAGKFNKKDRMNLTIDDLKKHVEYMYGENGQNPFNADTVIRYSLPVKPVNGDKSFTKRYAHCEVLLLQKNDIGPVVFYCFFTKAGYKKRNDYFSKLEQAFAFKE